MDKKEEKKELLEDFLLDEVTGAKVSLRCPADQGDHKWDPDLPGRHFCTCVKCGQKIWVTK